MPHVGRLSPPAPPPPAAGRADAAPAAAAPRPGAVVEAEIVRELGGGEGLVRIDGRVWRALYPEGLPQGARLALRLVEPGPPLAFQLAEPADAALTRLLHPPMQGLGSAVAALLAPPSGEALAGEALAAARWLDLPLEPAALARALARWVRGAGLFHEAALARGQEPADLKSALLRLVARLPEGSALREAADALLGHLSAHQARSVLEGVLVLPLVLPWGEEPIQGELRLEGDGGRAGGKARSRLLRLRLQMPHLGPVEVRVRWGEAGVSVRLAVAPEVLDAARSRLGELGELLRGRAGIRVAELRADPLPPPEPRAGRSLVEVLA